MQKPHPKLLNQAVSSVDVVGQRWQVNARCTDTIGAVPSECKYPLLLNCHYANEPLKSHVITLINMHHLPSEGDLYGWDKRGGTSQLSSSSHET